MSINTAERTALGGGDGDDSQYIEQGIDALEDTLAIELGFRPGEYVIEPVAFAPNSLGALQRGRRNSVGIHTGRLVMHRRQIVGYTPKIARNLYEAG